MKAIVTLEVKRKPTRRVLPEYPHVSISREAAEVVNRLAEESDLSIRKIVSEIILQAADHIEIVEVD